MNGAQTAIERLESLIARAEAQIEDLEAMKAGGLALTETIRGTEREVTDEAIASERMKVERWRRVLERHRAAG